MTGNSAISAPQGVARTAPIEFSAPWMAALNDIAAERFSAGLLRDGLGHLAWSSKPACYVESGDEDGLWEDIHHCASQAQVRPNFMVLGLTENQGLPKDEQSGFIINLQNSLDSIRDNRAFFNNRFQLEDTTDDASVLHEHVLPLMRSMNYRSFQGEAELMAIMLGFGKSNAHAYLDSISNDPAKAADTKRQTEVVNAWIQKRKQELLIGQESPELFPAPPPFAKYFTEETLALLERYLRSSSEMHAAFAAMLLVHEDETDASEAGDGRILGAAFLNSILHSDPASSVPLSPMMSEALADD